MDLCSMREEHKRAGQAWRLNMSLCHLVTTGNFSITSPQGPLAQLARKRGRVHAIAGSLHPYFLENLPPGSPGPTCQELGASACNRWFAPPYFLEKTRFSRDLTGKKCGATLRVAFHDAERRATLTF